MSSADLTENIAKQQSNLLNVGDSANCFFYLGF